MGNVALHRENLVNTAMRLFRRQGYASTGLQQILAESGAPKGSLYYYFPKGKEELASAAVEHAGGLIAQMLTELSTKHETPAAFVTAYCRTMAGWMAESEFRSGCPIATTMLETVPESPELAATGAAALDKWSDIIAAVLQRDGTTRAKAKRRANHLIGCVEGALIVARIRASTQPILDVARYWGE